MTDSDAPPRSLIVERIHREGPIPFNAFVEAALYGPGGFFASGGGAGRGGRDFITSPEVGPLFGGCVARFLDREWERLGRPDPFIVVDAGAGNGRLAREVLRAAPACAPALHIVLVERSAALREEQAERLTLEPFADVLGPAAVLDAGEAPELVGGLGPIVSALDAMPARSIDGVILANELLDNLAFDLLERTEPGWAEVRVGLDPDEHFIEVLIPAAPHLAECVAEVDAPIGARLPTALEVSEWIVQSASILRRGSMLLLDYLQPWSELVDRGTGWLRTYSGHTRGSTPLDAPGTQDITIDVPIEVVRRAARRASLSVAA
ncbi:MAG: SAM-dependent methyltransferase, partial [Acidimicrobiia bacterium]|nr:SAM-dependent methyltransferase [Acidimicrobiia bacterium]